MARHGLNSQQYQQAFDQLVRQGFQLKLVNGYSVAGQELFAAIWEQDGGPAFANHADSASKTRPVRQDVIE